MSGTALSTPILQRRLRIPSIRTNIRLVEHFLLEIDKTMRFGEDALDRIMICVTEAVNNGIIHGNKTDPAKFVDLECSCFDGIAEFVVQDQGTGFVVDDVPDPLDEQNLLKEGGRGVLIIRAMMDEVEITSDEGGTRICMRIKR